MPGPVTTPFIDQSLEQHTMRKYGLLGRGKAMGNALYSVTYAMLPREARTTIDLIIAGGPFPFVKDDTEFGNLFGDLPAGKYREYTVITPDPAGKKKQEGEKPKRGKRRIVARLTTCQLFFTACHYERVGVSGGTKPEQAAAQLTATAALDSEWRNGFYIITGMGPELREKISQAIKAKSLSA